MSLRRRRCCLGPPQPLVTHIVGGDKAGGLRLGLRRGLRLARRRAALCRVRNDAPIRRRELCTIDGRFAGALCRGTTRRGGGGAQARAAVATVSSTSGRRILSCRYRGARPVAVAVAVLCFASLATGVQQFFSRPPSGLQEECLPFFLRKCELALWVLAQVKLL